ncbi:MAG: BT_3928 family protein [Bacteroidales bacterium]|jgi:hypothetical protein
MKVLRIIAIITVGAVFVFSGTVKAIDPLGSAYKFHDYFQAFGMGFLQFLSLPFSIILCLTEFLTGFTILTGIRRREGIWGALILMIIFTPLTFILALTNPVSDCGCFGDAVHLTNWQTFGKNMILISFVIFLFSERYKTDGRIRRSYQWIIASLAALTFTGFILYNLTFLPLIDFLPYSTGTYIPGKMMMPAGAPVTQYETTFIYEKEGKRKAFSIKDYPAGDSTWKFIEQRSRLIKKGYLPPIHDFSVTTRDNVNITDSILRTPDPIILMVSGKLRGAARKNLEKGFEAGRKCISDSIGFYVLTASGSDEISSYDNGLQFCTTDETTLKTMVRSNPGYILLIKGTIEGKWSWANLPENISERIRKLNSTETNNIQK